MGKWYRKINLLRSTQLNGILRFFIVGLVYYLGCEQRIFTPYDLLRGSVIESIVQFKLSEPETYYGFYHFANHLFVCGEDSIFILSVGTPTSPQRVGAVPIGWGRKTTYINPPYLYIFRHPRILEVYDITTPTSPVYKDKIILETPHEGYLSAVGEFIFLLDNLREHEQANWRLIVIKNTAGSLQLIKTYNLTSEVKYVHGAGITENIGLCPFDEKTLYLVWGYSSILKFDLSSLDTTRLTFMTEKYSKIFSMHIRGSFAYIFGSSCGSKEFPRRSREFGIGKISHSDFQKIGSAEAFGCHGFVFISDNYAYFISGIIYDISDKRGIYKKYLYRDRIPSLVEVNGYAYIFDYGTISILKL